MGTGRRWWREAGLLLFLFLAAWLPRVLALRAFVTVDERKWLNRAGNFFVALSNADWSATFQKEHPGVTIQWLGLLGYLTRFPGYVRWSGGAMTDDVLEQRLWASGLMTPLDLLVAGRWWVTLAIALAIVALFRPLRRLFGTGPALAATLFVAWSPYFVGLSRQLHPDGLLAALSVLALALWLVWMYDGQRPRDLAGAGIILGLALLTKTTAIFVGVTGVLLVAMELAKGLRHGTPRWSLLTGGVVWALLAAATFVLLWPAMWRAPVAVLQRIIDQMAHYQGEVHSLPTYFRGRVVHDDPGWLFYPFVVAWRMSPLTLIGLPLTAWVAWRRRAPLAQTAARNAALGLLLFAAVVVLVLSTGAKKIDRYVLPALPALDILAALGWTGVAGAVTAARGTPRNRMLATAALVGVILLHGLFTLWQFPYYLTYFNPLLGGARVAPRVMMIGWGEGLEQVGAWLGQQAHDGPLHVVSWYDDGPLSYTMPGDIRHQDFIDSDIYWFDADFAVLYANQWQRENPDPEMIAHFLAQEPAFAVNAKGLELAKVYDLRGVPPPPFTGLHVESAGALTDALHLDAYRLATSSVLPGEEAPLSLFLRTTTPLDHDIHTRLTLRGPTGDTVWTETRPPAGMRTRDWTPETVYEDAYVIPVPADAAPGEYALAVELMDADSGALLTPQPHLVTTLTVQAPATQPLDVVWGDVALTEIRYAPRVAPGHTLVVDLVAAGQMAGVKLSLRLVDDAGKTWAQQDREMAPDMRFDLTLPADAPPGTYRIEGVAYDGATLAARVDAAGASPSGLGVVEVE